MMRILFLLTQDLESPAGIGRYFPLAKALAGRGHQVSIVALHADFAHASQKHFVRNGVDIHYVAQMHVLKRGDIKEYFSPPILLTRSLQATWALTRAALKIQADIIHIGKPQPMNGIAGWIAKRLRGRVLFVDCDDLEAAENRFSARWQYRVVSFFERWIPQQADHITTHTHVLQKQLQAIGIPITSEEVIRMESHLRLFASKVAEEGPAGRGLDFVLQEMNREVNTIGAKATDVDIAQRVIALKGELERMREQVQNIE